MVREGLVEGFCLVFKRKSGRWLVVFVVGVICAREVEAEFCGCAAFSLNREVVVLGWGLLGLARGEEERSDSDSQSEGMAAG